MLTGFLTYICTVRPKSYRTQSDLKVCVLCFTSALLNSESCIIFFCVVLHCGVMNHMMLDSSLKLP